MRDLTSTLQGLDPTGARAVRHALRIAGGIHCLRVAHLIVGLLVLDGRFILRKLRGLRINRADLVSQVYTAALTLNGGDLTGTLKILLLAGALAPPGVRINAQHLLAAILLADGNPVAAFLANAGIDCQLFVRQRFAHLFAVDNALPGLAPEVNAGVAVDTLGRDGAVLQAWAASPPPLPSAAPQRVSSDPDSRLAEPTAQQWLRQLIPAQGAGYTAHRFVEVDSTLIPGRRYRIHRNRQTEIYERGAGRRLRRQRRRRPRFHRPGRRGVSLSPASCGRHSSTRPFVADEEVAVRSLMAPEFDLTAFTASLALASCAAVLPWAVLVARHLRSRRFCALLEDREPRRAERAAQQWLRQLIPGQADRYAEHEFVEIDSTLIPGRRYRIHHNRSTDIYERGTLHRRSCLQLHDKWLPPTDRVSPSTF